MDEELCDKLPRTDHKEHVNRRPWSRLCLVFFFPLGVLVAFCVQFHTVAPESPGQFAGAEYVKGADREYQQERDTRNSIEKMKA